MGRCVKLLRMANEKTQGQHGSALMDYLRGEWEARGMTQTAFARAARVENSNFSRWADGGNPWNIDLLRQIADTLNVPLTKVLLAAEYLRDEEVDGRIDRTPMRAPSIDDAIESDPTLSSAERALLRTARELARARRLEDDERKSRNRGKS